MIQGIITATICVALTGLLIGIFLGLADKKFGVEIDERQAAVEKALPGNNCGGCGFAGCAALAEAIAKGEAPVNACPVGGSPVADNIAGIMGLDAAGDGVKMSAYVKCAGDCEKAKTDYTYTGNSSCVMQSNTPGKGPKACTYGCLGGGDCVKACQFGAISIKNGIAVVNELLCTSCGMCAKACPRGIIELVPVDKKVRVACSSKDKGPVAMKACDTACIGCMMCKKECPNDAVVIEDFLAKIDYEKCVECGACVLKCPRKAIINKNEA